MTQNLYLIEPEASVLRRDKRAKKNQRLNIFLKLLFVRLYGNDTVLLNGIEESMQKVINDRFKYCRPNDLKINASKIHIFSTCQKRR